VELQFRGVVFSNKGRDWTIVTLLTAGPGLQLRIAKDVATKGALLRAFPRLLDEPVDALRRAGELDASFFDELLNPDGVRTLLQWLSNPESVFALLSKAEWQAFTSMCRSIYRFDPERDGPITAARSLGERPGPWEQVWHRYREAPERYPGIPERLWAAQPDTLTFENRDSWPLLNAEDEKTVRAALMRTEAMPAQEARMVVRQLEAEHKARRSTVWAQLGRAPLATALEHLAALADNTEHFAPSGSATEIATWYAEVGWHADACAMHALALGNDKPDIQALEMAVTALSREWLDRGARSLQSSFVAAAPVADSEGEAEPGTCVMFVDGLRLDVAHEVAAALGDRARVVVQWRFSAIPTITQTAKPAVSPIARDLFAGPQLAPAAKENGPALSTEVFRRLLADQGWQYVADGSWGDPAGLGWTEGGDIDNQGHTLAAKFPRRLASEAQEIAEHALSLLGLGWRRVVIVTDHGWLYLPGGLPKVDLPIHAADIRKGRCARVAEGAKVEVPNLPWRWAPSVLIAVAPGIACFEAGKVYEHGGVSPQESVTPRIVVEPQPQEVAAAPTVIRVVRWVGLRCRVEVEHASAGASVDIRGKPADRSTSLVQDSKVLVAGKASLVVPDDSNEGHAAVVVVLSPDGGVVAQRLTTVGGEAE